MYECEKCGRHWWAKRLEIGPVRPQLAEMYSSEEGESVEWLVEEVMEAFGLPDRIDTPLYWQVQTTDGRQWHRYVTAHDQPFRQRTRIFLREFMALFRAAS